MIDSWPVFEQQGRMTPARPKFGTIPRRCCSTKLLTLDNVVDDIEEHGLYEEEGS
jgi:hypothetical protein